MAECIYDERVRRIKDAVIRVARRRFRDGEYGNPYIVDQMQPFGMKAGMAGIYDKEIQVLLKERICPCCGQPTMGDFDY